MSSPLPSIARLRRRAGAAFWLAVAFVAASAADVDPARAAIERLIRDGQVDAARQQIDAALRVRPDDAAVRFLSGVLLAQTGRDPEAMSIYRRLIEEHPDLPEPYNNLAVLHAARGDWDTARALLEAALRNDPKYLIAQRNLGDVFAQLSLRAYEAAAVARPVDPALARRLRLARELTSSGAGQ